ncbi:peptidyl-prolyl cis-trans isomerase CYP59 [Impatiens glandulifera]|uniref:peptidyl-prolyl cis-trans isomerase CYP59 n=1 Tax=Impatiens glandulifera TaxID=253017 RepID=UPI001FB19F0B|nr:peptidyl-prolyl cis-trans isomerase CYP59 [Impatiens glandulifera]
MSILLVTSLGDIVIDLFTDLCPLTCKNFLKLCKIKYYNGCLFHTVQKDFTAQTGDPTGTGSGGDSIYKFLFGDQARFFGDEIRLDIKHKKMGTVAMASAGEDLNASQFYITLRDDLDYLDGKHTVFGEVAEGIETLERLNEAYVDEKSRPYKNIRIKHTYILDDPFDDPPHLTEFIPDASPEGKPKDEVDDVVRLEDDWVPMDEQLSTAELEEIIRVKEAHSSAVVLETIGDIPEAEVKPPDNVLFVCKLNPVTEDEDLHTIFSRFGTVISAEVIRDFKTGDSLCYSFIEFEDKDACEQAYFKMDNALIDDRRIHVDFSQSVSKLWSDYRRRDLQKGKGKGCFKCGALDHIAKDCGGDSSTQQQPPKYTIKDDNTQRGGGGGDNNSRYEMVFDEGPVKTHHEIEKKQTGEKQISEDFRKKEGEDDNRRDRASREYRDRDRNRGRELDVQEREKDMDKRRDYRSSDRDNNRNGSREYVKRSRDDENRDRKNDERHRRTGRDEEDGRRSRKEEGDNGRRSREVDNYRDREKFNDGRDRRNEDRSKGDRDYRKRSREREDDHDRRSRR